MKEKKAWIGAGSNLGNKKKNLQKAVDLFDKHEIRFLRSSSLYETAPVGFESDDKFINCVFEVSFSCTSEELLKKILHIEKILGRERSATIRYTSRTIDLDILLIENEVINTPELVVPHPLMHTRIFVLVPLSELIPLTLHPVLNQSVELLKSGCIDENGIFIHDKPLFVNR